MDIEELLSGNKLWNEQKSLLMQRDANQNIYYATIRLIKYFLIGMNAYLPNESNPKMIEIMGSLPSWLKQPFQKHRSQKNLRKKGEKKQEKEQNQNQLQQVQ